MKQRKDETKDKIRKRKLQNGTNKQNYNVNSWRLIQSNAINSKNMFIQ